MALSVGKNIHLLFSEQLNKHFLIGTVSPDGQINCVAGIV